jgi:tyrosine-protein kinase Etk/Wzc
MPSDEVNLLDYWRVLWKRRRLIAGLTGGAVLITMVVSLLMPKIYKATATILPPLESGSFGGLAASALNVQGFGLDLPNTPATPLDLFLAMLGSQTLAEEVAKKFDLVTRYQVKTLEDAADALKGSTKVTTTLEKVIQVTVLAEDPELAADLANAHVAALDDLNQKLAISKAGQRRRFLERRLAEAQADLVQGEQALAAFQTENKAVALPEQATAALKAAAEIQGRISAAEVQLEVMRNFLTPNNPDLIKLKLEIGQLKQQLHLLESGKDGKGMLPGDRLHPAFVTVPTLGLEYAKLLREVKVQETLFTMLTTQYEQAKLEEARDTPTVQMLDRAKPPTKKFKPKIRLNMAIAGLLGLLTGVFLAFILEAIPPATLERGTRRIARFLPFVR